MPTPRYTITNESVTVILEGRPYTIKRGDGNFDEAKNALLDKRWGDVPALISKGMKLAGWAKGHFTFHDNAMYWNGEAMPTELNARMLKMANAGEDPTFLMFFWERLQKNPSWRSVQQLYNFLEHQGISVDQDGFLLAYKSVTRDYKDFHTMEVDNKVGVTNEMARNKISDDPTQGCHFGYHVGALAYAGSFGTNNRVVICRIDPADVVCIPNDSSHQKMRVCKYTVIGNHGGKLPDTTFNTSEDAAAQDTVAKGADNFAAALKSRKGQNRRKRKAVAKPMAGAEEWRTFGNLSDAQLLAQKVWDLRQYAGKILKIVGAARLRKVNVDANGVDTGLVARIIDVRSSG